MRKKENPKIEFISRIEFLKDIEEIRPQPANKFIPQWWKEMPWDNNLEQSRYRAEGGSVRQCPMFPELFSSGYILPMWADTTLFYRDGEWGWKSGSVGSPFKVSIFQSEQFLDKSEYKMNGVNATALFQLHNPWQIKTSKGYSLLQIPLFYHFNNEFSVMPGNYDGNVVNTDKLEIAYHGNGKEIFIKRGTPLAQFIPYKKEKIDLVVRDITEQDKQDTSKLNVQRSVMFKNWYSQNRNRGSN
jgi:hypothetical protein